MTPSTSLRPGRAQALGIALAAAVALVAGGIRETTLDLTQYAAFTLVNLALLAGAFWFVLPAVGGAACLLLFAGPTIWWIDKPTTDVLAFSLVAIGMTLFGNFERRTSNVELTLSIFALLVAIALPAYGHGFHWPSFAEFLAVPFDPAIGLVTNFPILVLVVGAALVLQARRRTAVSRDQIAAAVVGVALLVSVSQAANLHGDTPGLSRYVNGFVPLAIPFLRGGTSWIAAGASALLCVALFHPATPLYARQPTRIANYLWTQHPGWNNPLPEVFSEMMHTGEDRPVPAATANCEKLLIAGAGNGAIFPVPCFPAAAPAECAAPGALCYANRDGAGYQFVAAPGGAARREGFTPLARFAWPASVPPQLRDVLTQWDWWTLRPKSSDVRIVREIHGVRVLELEGAGRLVLILRQPSPGARLALRPPSNITGALVDGKTGQTLRALEFNDEPLARWEIEIPSEHELLLLSLQTS